MRVSEEYPGSWSVRWRWFEPSYIFLLFFCIAWDGFLVFWYSMALFGNAPLIAIIFPVCYVAVGVGLTYAVLAGFFNTTTVTLDGVNLTIRHAPVYWRGNRRIPVETIEQLFCRRSRMRSENSTRYEFCAALSGGGEVCLLTLPALGEGRFLEQQIETRLGISPARVAGECREE